jgi:hypothetical protein
MRIPKVLLRARKEANAETMEKKSGPWDQGHWANRK